MDPTATLFAPADEAIDASFGDTLVELGRAAKSFRMQVAPNPCVGAAVFSDGVEVGRGFHRAWGGPHAEVNALEAAAQSGVPAERWDTLVATLEPCSSHGKTPPCTEAILRAGIRRVVVGAADPDPRHRGRSLEALHQAGVEVVVLPRRSPLREVAPHFLDWTDPDRLRRPHPWTLAKWAQTRTGQLQPPKDVGDGRWISAPASLDEVQLLRSRVDAIVTGIGTVLADEPRLTVRPPGDPRRAPLRVVLDSYLRTRLDAQLLRAPSSPEAEAGGAVHLLALPGASPSRHRALREAGAEVHPVRAGERGGLSLLEVQAWLWERGVRRVLLEAGPKLLEAYFEAELVDQVAVTTGNVSGGRGPSLGKWLEPRRLRQVLHREVGEDAILEAFYAPHR